MGVNTTRIEISKEYLNFSVGHFTIFDESHRENLHGHNYRIAAEIDASIGDGGLTFDYNLIKKVMKQLCEKVDEQVLIPEKSPFLTIEEDKQYVYVLFDKERLPFLERDITLLPIKNITIEELSTYFLDCFLAHEDVKSAPITKVTMKCSSGDGQWASSGWCQEA